mmetsp:Transcript_14043/g.56992  ORF Transcript_14043/g.56992 Transcript_14043/m.56992 type:complete len:252 (+) Transcript_14043:1777-2532(+)
MGGRRAEGFAGGVAVAAHHGASGTSRRVRVQDFAQTHARGSVGRGDPAKGTHRGCPRGVPAVQPNHGAAAAEERGEPVELPAERCAAAGGEPGSGGSGRGVLKRSCDERGRGPERRGRRRARWTLPALQSDWAVEHRGAWTGGAAVGNHPEYAVAALQQTPEGRREGPRRGIHHLETNLPPLWHREVAQAEPQVEARPAAERAQDAQRGDGRCHLWRRSVEPGGLRSRRRVRRRGNERPTRRERVRRIAHA